MRYKCSIDTVFLFECLFTVDSLPSLSPTYPVPLNSILKVNAKLRRMHAHWLVRNTTQKCHFSRKWPMAVLSDKAGGNWDSPWGSAGNLLETVSFESGVHVLSTLHTLSVDAWDNLCRMEAQGRSLVSVASGWRQNRAEPGLEPRWYISSPPPSHSLRNAEGRGAWGQS